MEERLPRTLFVVFQSSASPELSASIAYVVEQWRHHRNASAVLYFGGVHNYNLVGHLNVK